MSTNNPMSNIPPLGPPTGMMPGGGPGKFKPIDPLRVLRANWLWIACAVVIGAGVGVGAWFGLHKYIPKFTSEAQFEVQATNLNAATGSNTPVRMAELEPIINREIQSLLSDPTLNDVLNRPSVQGTEWFAQFDDNMADALEDMKKHVIRASSLREAPLILATARAQNEDDALIILSALRDEYMRKKQEQRVIEEEQYMRAAQDRYNAALDRITSIKGTISRFLASNRIDALDQRSTEAALQVSRLVVQKGELDNQYNSLEATYNQLLDRQKKDDFEPSDENRYQIENSQAIIEIDRQLRQLRVARQSQLDRFKEDHPVIRSLDEQILAMQRERREKFDEQARSLFNATIEQAAMGRQILSEELTKVNNALAEWNLKRQEAVRLLDQYDTMKRELEQAETEREMANTAIQDLVEQRKRDARVVVKVQVPPQEAKETFPPDLWVVILGSTMLVTTMVTGLIFLRELMDQRVRSAADVKMIPDAALVGMVPSADEDRGGSRKIERVVEQDPGGLLAESFRQVRTAVLSKMDRRGYKTLMVVSAKPEAGVTTIAQNLSASCALSGRRVLIIDANFRRPGMGRLMGLPNEPGLADVLCGDVELDRLGEVTQDTPTPGLSLLPAGNTRNAAVEFFESARFRELMARLESEYDLLVIDAPPALLTSDAQLLTRHIDAMLLVSRARSDTRGMLQRLYRELDGQRADILGVVLNGVQASVGGYLKRNFKEFQDYSGPDRRSGGRSATPAAPARGTSNGTPAAVNGSAHAEQAAQPMPMTLEADDDDVFGGFDLDDEEDQNK